MSTDSTISQLPTAGSLTGTEVIPIDQGSTKSVSVNSLLASSLSGTFSAITVGTGHDSAITLPSQVANENFQINVGGGTFNSIFDPNMGWGYNVNRQNSSEPALSWNIEAHFFDGATHFMEINTNYTNSTGTTTRFLNMQVNRTTDAGAWYFSGSNINLQQDFSGGTTNYISCTSGTIPTVLAGGWWGFSNSPQTSRRILIGGTQNSGTDERGVDNTTTIGSNVTQSYTSFVSEVSTAAASFTVDHIDNFIAFDGAKGSGSTITNNFGFRVTSFTLGTNNYGFKGELTSGANNWNLNMSGTAQNFLQGVTGIGIAASSTTQLALAAGTTAVSSLRVPHGSAPTSPVNGDMWTTTSGLFVRINGATVGPLT